MMELIQKPDDPPQNTTDMVRLDWCIEMTKYLSDNQLCTLSDRKEGLIRISNEMRKVKKSLISHRHQG